MLKVAGRTTFRLLFGMLCILIEISAFVWDVSSNQMISRNSTLRMQKSLEDVFVKVDPKFISNVHPYD